MNRGVLPGMPAADDQEFIDYDQAKATQLFNDCNAADNWTKDQPLRIVFDKSFAGVEQWVPIFAQDLEAVGFKTELNGLESTAAIELYNKIDQWESHHRPGRRPGGRPIQDRELLRLRAERARGLAGIPEDCSINELYAQARQELDETKRTELFKQISSKINKGFDRVSFWTTNALSAKVKGLEGVQIPPNTREFITRAYKWTLTK